jgi:hypothetical protein
MCCACAAGVKFENSCEVGVFARLTNAYCLVPAGAASQGFYRFVDDDGRLLASTNLSIANGLLRPALLIFDPQLTYVCSDHRHAVCSRASSPAPSPWSGPPSPAPGSSGGSASATREGCCFPIPPPTKVLLLLRSFAYCKLHGVPKVVAPIALL